MSTVQSLSKMMKPGVVGNNADCETCGKDGSKTVERVVIKTILKSDVFIPSNDIGAGSMANGDDAESNIVEKKQGRPKKVVGE